MASKLLRKYEVENEAVFRRFFREFIFKTYTDITIPVTENVNTGTTL